MNEDENPDNQQKCFTLPNISAHIFKILKTNMVFYNDIFLKSFFENLDFEYKKKFILYNYMLSNNRSYGLLEIKNLKKKIEEKEELPEKQFVENFIINFSLFIKIFKEKTVFASTHSKLLTFENIGNMILSMMPLNQLSVEANEGGEDIAGILFDLLNTLLMATFPFLAVIPLFVFFLKKIEIRIFKFCRDRIMNMLSEEMKNKFTAKPTFKPKSSDELIYLNPFDANYFDNLVASEAFMNEISKFDKIDIKTDKVNDIQDNYTKVLSNENFDFNLFDTIDLFVIEENEVTNHLENKIYNGDLGDSIEEVDELDLYLKDLLI